MNINASERIVVTATSAITGLGTDLAAIVAAMESGEERAAALAQPEATPSDLPDAVKEVVPVLRMAAIDPLKVPGLKRPFPDRLTVAAIHAADAAFKNARNLIEQVDPDRRALLMSSSMGPVASVEKYLRTLLTQGPERVSAITFPRSVANAVLGEVSRRHQLRGPGTLLMGSHVVGYAVDLLRSGKADAVLCIGVESLGDYTPWAYRREGLLDHGMVLADGAAGLVLERLEHAQRRGADIVAEVDGQAIGSCPHAPRRITDIAGPSIESVMSRLAEVIGRGDHDLVFGLENGHQPLATAERAVVQKLCGSTRFLSPKRSVGETFGASEVLSVAVGAEALRARAFGGASRILVNAAHVGGALSSTAMQEYVS